MGWKDAPLVEDTVGPAWQSAPLVESSRSFVSPQPTQQPSAASSSTVQDRAREMFGFKDYANRGTILPYGITKAGETEFATPQIITDMMTSALLPGHAAKGGDFTAQDVAKFTLDYGAPATSRTSLTSKSVTPSKKVYTKNAPSTKELKSLSDNFYKSAEGSNVVVHPDSYSAFLDDLTDNLVREGFDEDLHKPMAAAVKALTKRDGEGMDFQALNTARKQVGDAAASPESGVRRLAKITKNKLDDYVENLDTYDLLVGDKEGASRASAGLRTARNLWSRSRKSEVIEDALKNAELAASGFENGIRMEFRRILKNKNKLRGFTDQERAVMKDIVMGTTPEKLMRLLGKFSLIRSDAGNMFGGSIGVGGGAAIGSSLGGPVGAAVGAAIPPAIGHIGQKAAERSTINKALLARALAAKSGNLPSPRLDELKKARLLALGFGPMIGAGGLQGGQ